MIITNADERGEVSPLPPARFAVFRRPPLRGFHPPNAPGPQTVRALSRGLEYPRITNQKIESTLGVKRTDIVTAWATTGFRRRKWPIPSSGL
jgi:hypothetical protein